MTVPVDLIAEKNLVDLEVRQVHVRAGHRSGLVLVLRLF